MNALSKDLTMSCGKSLIELFEIVVYSDVCCIMYISILIIFLHAHQYLRISKVSKYIRPCFNVLETH